MNLLADTLAETLQTDPAGGAALVERIGQGLKRIQRDLRAVMRGLVPVPVDTQGLMASLIDLADSTRQLGRANCTFDCDEPVSVRDNLVATHLYLIAQEAVHNALKHARSRNIRISLRAAHRLVLRVEDDGIGMPAHPRENQGLGLRIMANRAAIIGATLTIESAPSGGTLMTCVLARRDDERRDEASRPGPDRR